jgi:hypothetical protein
MEIFIKKNSALWVGSEAFFVNSSYIYVQKGRLSFVEGVLY